MNRTTPTSQRLSCLALHSLLILTGIGAAAFGNWQVNAVSEPQLSGQFETAMPAMQAAGVTSTTRVDSQAVADAT